MAENKDFLAICSVAPGGGSFGRSSTTHEAVSICKRHVEQDWHHLYHLDGVEAPVMIYDVTGYDSLFWDDFGVHPNNDPKVTLELHSTATIRLSVPKQRKKKRAKT